MRTIDGPGALGSTFSVELADTLAPRDSPQNHDLCPNVFPRHALRAKFLSFRLVSPLFSSLPAVISSTTQHIARSPSPVSRVVNPQNTSPSSASRPSSSSPASADAHRHFASSPLDILALYPLPGLSASASATVFTLLVVAVTPGAPYSFSIRRFLYAQNFLFVVAATPPAALAVLASFLVRFRRSSSDDDGPSPSDCYEVPFSPLYPPYLRSRTVSVGTWLRMYLN
jgi:hypothetical protein